MGILDKMFDRDDDEKKKRPADFSNVQSGASSTAPATPRADASTLNPSLADAPAASAGGTRTYTVKAGDSLSKIAKREYGDASQWTRIYEANKGSIKDPDLIYPGQTFTLP